MYRFFIVFLICLCSNFAVNAETISSLSFEQALKIALENNPSLEAERLGLDVNKAEIKTARARPDPQLFTDSGIAEDTYRVGISYNFEMGGKRKKRGQISETILEQAELSLEAKLLYFKEELRNAYAALFYSQERLRLRNELKTSYEELLEISKRREKLGDIAQIDVLQVESIKVNNENQRKKVTYELNQFHNNLEYLLNSKLNRDIQLEAPIEGLEDQELKELLDLAIEARPELKANQASQKQTELELDLAKTKRIPNLTLSAGPDFVTGNEGQTSAFVIAQINLPVFNLRRGEIEAAEAKNQQLLAKREAEVNRIRTEVKQNYSAYISQKEILEDYKNKLIPIQKEYADKRLRSFELGKSAIWVALDAQSQYIKARLEYIQMALEYQQTISSLERSIGVALP